MLRLLREDRGGPPLAGRALATLAALAALPRLLGLGASSMWLDEILQTRQMRGSVGALLAAQVGDDHPPLDALVAMGLVHAGAGEAVRRLLPALWGVLTVVVLARWVSERLGPATGALSGMLAAFSPIHVHYSQELRPYALALLLVTLALWRLDALLRAPGRRNAWLLGASLAACAWTLYLSVVVLVPLAVLWLEARGGRPPELAAGARWAASRAPLLLAGLAVAVAPVVSRAFAMPGRAMQAGAATWDATAVARRWQVLAVGGVEGAGFGWGGAVAGLLALAGAACAARTPAGRAALAGLLAGTAGVELLLALAGHWSNARYDLPAWPFVVVLLSLGLAGLAGGAPVSARHRGLALGGVMALLAAELAGLGEGLLGSRPDWRRAAAAVAGAARPGEALLAANEWTRVSLLHYLEAAGRGDLAARLVAIDGDPARLEAALVGSPCALLASGGYPVSGRLASRLAGRPAWLEVPQTARLDLITGAGGGAGAGAEEACARPVPLAAGRSLPLPARLAPRLFTAPTEDLRLDFDAAAAPHLLGGFSGPERTPEGVSFRWVVGREAEIAIALERPRELVLRLALWPFDGALDGQTLGVTINGISAGERALVAGRQVLELRPPEASWRAGENRIGLRFTRAVAPAALAAGASDARPLAAALDELQLVER